MTTEQPQMTTPELYILRHGETYWNAENRMQGELNSPLTEKGLRDAARQGQILSARDLSGFAFFTSPQGRADRIWQTACKTCWNETCTCANTGLNDASSGD